MQTVLKKFAGLYKLQKHLSCTKETVSPYLVQVDYIKIDHPVLGNAAESHATMF